eukprot:5983769-Amphidinium_carterae.1
MISLRERHDLEAVRQRRGALQDVKDCRNDRDVVLTAVSTYGRALQFAAEALKGDRAIVLAAVQHYGDALEYATEALRADGEIVLTAVQKDGWALKYTTQVQQNSNALLFTASCLLEDPTFATEAKEVFFLLRLTMLSGRSTVVAAGPAYQHEWYYENWHVDVVLAKCRTNLGLTDDGATMELWHGSDIVPEETPVEHWPGIKPPGEISEYQLDVMP